MRNSQQLNFFGKTVLEHGGVLSHGKRKGVRTLSTRHAIHIVLRSDRAKGSLSLLNHRNKIERLIWKWAKYFQISIYEKAIVSNHIHLLIRGKKRNDLQDFFRTIAALIARLVTGTRKGKPFGKFWSYLFYSRSLSSWKKEFSTAKDYIMQNSLEAFGMIPYKPRKNRRYAIF